MQSGRRQYFYCSKQEKTGLIVLLGLVVILFCVHWLVQLPRARSMDLSEEEKEEIQNFIQSFRERTETFVYSEREKPQVEKVDQVLLYPFDPNQVSEEELLTLGLSDYVVSNILKYRRAGGRFLRPEDLKKIYGMKEEVYIRIKPYVNIDSIKNNIPGDTDNSSITHFEEKKDSLELNSVSVSDLLQLEGMDKRLSGRIIKYRELLGGYYSVAQLKEVYGMTDSVFEILKERTYADSLTLRLLDPVNAGFRELLRHPYLNKTSVELLIEMQSFYSDSFSIHHIKQNRVLPDSVLEALLPYIKD